MENEGRKVHTRQTLPTAIYYSNATSAQCKSWTRLLSDKIPEKSPVRAWIAYLPAFSIAEIKAQRLTDDALHLTSGSQVARFGHVIGSLWSADDKTCVGSQSYRLGLYL
jgi:hypothetical protein